MKCVTASACIWKWVSGCRASELYSLYKNVSQHWGYQHPLLQRFTNMTAGRGVPSFRSLPKQFRGCQHQSQMDNQQVYTTRQKDGSSNTNTDDNSQARSGQQESPSREILLYTTQARSGQKGSPPGKLLQVAVNPGSYWEIAMEWLNCCSYDNTAQHQRSWISNKEITMEWSGDSKSLNPAKAYVASMLPVVEVSKAWGASTYIHTRGSGMFHMGGLGLMSPSHQFWSAAHSQWVPECSTVS